MLKIAVLLFVGTCVSANLFEFGINGDASGAGVAVGGKVDASGALNGLGGLLNIGKGLVGQAQQNVGGLINSGIKLGGDISGQLTTGLNGAVSAAHNLVGDIVGKFANKIQDVGATIGGLLAAGEKIPTQLYTDFQNIADQMHAEFGKVFGQLTSNFDGLSENLTKCIKGGVQTINANLKNTVNGVINGANAITANVKQHLIDGQKQLGNVCNQLHEAAVKGCAKAQETVNGLKGKAEELAKQLETGLLTTKNALEKQIQDLEAGIGKLPEDAKVKVNAAIAQLKQKVADIEKQKQKLQEFACNQFHEFQQKGKDFLSNLEAKLNNELGELGTHFQKASENIKQIVAQKSAQFNGMVEEVAVKLAEAKAKGAKYAVKLEENLKNLLTEGKAHLESDLKVIEDKMTTATDEGKQFLATLEAEIKAKIAEVEKQLEGGVTINAGLNVDGKGVGADLSVGTNGNGQINIATQVETPVVSV